MMKKNMQRVIKRDLEVFPLIAYFFFYILYLLFDKILEMKDYALLVKPIIIPIIVFLYITNKKSKRTLLNMVLLILIFISDNSALLEIRSFHIYATIIYLFCLVIFMYYAISDFQIKVNRKKLAISLVGLLLLSLLYVFFNYSFKDKAAEKFIVFEYMILFLLVFFASLFNFISQKTEKTKYLFLTILCLFLSDLCFSIHHYYNGHIALKFLIFIIEIPVYYFLLKYLLKRDGELIEQ